MATMAEQEKELTREIQFLDTLIKSLNEGLKIIEEFRLDEPSEYDSIPEWREFRETARRERPLLSALLDGVKNVRARHELALRDITPD